MSIELDKLIQHIQDGITETFQNDMFNSNPDYSILIEACKNFLVYKGYKIITPVNCLYNVKKTDDLIHLFYALSDAKHPELMNSYRNLEKDRFLAKEFVKSRMLASGVNKEEAIKECAEIIDTIFRDEGEFNFEIPLTFGILGQKNCGWITDKAVQIINKKKLNIENEGREELIAEYERHYDAESGGFEDLDTILKTL